MKNNNRTKTIKIFFLLLFGFFAFSATSLVGSGSAYATSTNLVTMQDLALGIDFSASRIIPTMDGGYLLTGKQVYDERPAIAKVDFNQETEKYNFAWHWTGEKNGFFYDAVVLENGNIIAVGEQGGGGIIRIYDQNGNSLNNYDYGDAALFRFITSYNDSQILVAATNTNDAYAIYSFDYDNNNGSLSLSDSSSLSSDERILGVSSNQTKFYIITSRAVRYVNHNDTLNTTKLFTAQISAGYHIDSLGFVIASEGNNIKFYDEDGVFQWERTIENSNLHDISAYYDQDNSDVIVYARGENTRQCDFGGAYTNQNIYKVQYDGVVYQKSLPSDGSYSNILVTSPTDIVIAKAVDQNSNAIWYTEGDSVDISYAISSINNPVYTSCGVTTIEPDTAFTPKYPSADGFTFDGWYTDPEFNNRFIDQTTISEDITLYGRWEADSYGAPDQDTTHTISFEVVSANGPENYSASDFQKLIVQHGKTISLPAPGNKEWAFDGWYTDRELTDKYDESTPVTSSFTLYGAWINLTLIIKEDEYSNLEMIWQGDSSAASFNANSKTLTINGLNGYSIDIQTGQEVAIFVEGENKIDGGGVLANGSLNISGTGSLNVTGSIVRGISVGDNLTISNVNIVTTAMEGIHKVTINNANITSLVLGGDGDEVVVNNSIAKVSASCGGKSLVVQNNSRVSCGIIGSLNEDDAVDNNITVKNAVLNSTAMTALGKLVIEEGGELNLNYDAGDNGDAREGVDMFYAAVVVINGGTMNVHSSNEMVQIGGLFVKDGEFNMQAEGVSMPLLAHIIKNDGGEINVISQAPVEKSTPFVTALATMYAYFNGGKTKVSLISNGTSMSYAMAAIPAILKDDEEAEYLSGIYDMIEQVSGEELNIVDGEHLNFSGGDHVFNGGLASLAVLTKSYDLRQAIQLSDNMLTKPKEVKYVNLSIDSDGKDYRLQSFSDSNAEQSGGSMAHLVNSLRIYEGEQEDPVNPPISGEDAEVPNTTDFKIIGLTGLIFISVMTEGMIIADLYRRLHGYKEEDAPAVVESASANISVGLSTSISSTASTSSFQSVHPAQVQPRSNPTLNISGIKPIKKSNSYLS